MWFSTKLTHDRSLCVCVLVVAVLMQIMTILLYRQFICHHLICLQIWLSSAKQISQANWKTHFRSSKSKWSPSQNQKFGQIHLHLIGDQISNCISYARRVRTMPQQEIASAIQGKIRSGVKVIQNCTLFMYSLYTHTHDKFANHFKWGQTQIWNILVLLRSVCAQSRATTTNSNATRATDWEEKKYGKLVAISERKRNREKKAKSKIDRFWRNIFQ